MPLAKNQLIRLQIENISSDGNGVARYEGHVVFVAAAAVGDVLDVRLVKLAKTHAYGRIEQVISPGHGRQAEDCPISQTCGGCSFRHITYAAELDAKQNFVQDALKRIAKIPAECLPILPSPRENRYRNKVQYPVLQAEDGTLLYGFYAQRSHRIVPCDDCLLQPEEINHIASFATITLQNLGVSAYEETVDKGLVRHICIRKGEHSKDVLLCLVLTKPYLPHQKEFVAALVQKFPAITSIVLNINERKTNVIYGAQNLTIYGQGELHDSISDVPLWLNPRSFSQVNTPAAELLFSLVREWAALKPHHTLLDLYCGAGAIGLSMALDCKTLIGVEIVPESVASAKRSATAMGLTNTRFLCEDAGKAAARLAAEGIRPDVVVLDPPRKGCDAATLQALIAMSPKKIVMVSCNPATMARDIALLYADGYNVQKVQPIDLFPRTIHVETCVLLQHKNS